MRQLDGVCFSRAAMLVAAGMYGGEYYALALTSALGMLVMISAGGYIFAAVYRFGIDVATSLYAMIALDRR